MYTYKLSYADIAYQDRCIISLTRTNSTDETSEVIRATITRQSKYDELTEISFGLHNKDEIKSRHSMAFTQDQIGYSENCLIHNDDYVVNPQLGPDLKKLPGGNVNAYVVKQKSCYDHLHEQKDVVTNESILHKRVKSLLQVEFPNDGRIILFKFLNREVELTGNCCRFSDITKLNDDETALIDDIFKTAHDQGFFANISYKAKPKDVSIAREQKESQATDITMMPNPLDGNASNNSSALFSQRVLRSQTNAKKSKIGDAFDTRFVFN